RPPRGPGHPVGGHATVGGCAPAHRRPAGAGIGLSRMRAADPRGVVLMPLHIGELTSEVVATGAAPEPPDAPGSAAPRRRRSTDDAWRAARERACRLEATDRDD
ncbi:MAG: hypothetical protein ACK5PP_04725, partial [Acidimicrobiales bacterium]